MNQSFYSFLSMFKFMHIKIFIYKIILHQTLMIQKIIPFIIAIISSFLLITSFNYATLPAPTNADLDCGFTSDFQDFLDKNGYSKYNFNRPDIKCGAYGGKATNHTKIKQTPVIFIHGNSDVAFGRGVTDGYASWQTGFRQLAVFLSTKNYEKAQMYTTTWGSANPDLALQNYHSKDYLTKMRAFVQAVIAYTGAQKVNIISHSMGVTIARKVVKGGIAYDHSAGNYDLGPSLQLKVKSFIGIAGGNLGLATCLNTPILPACSPKDGFFPGATVVSPPSEYLNDLNKSGGSEGSNVYAIWSKYDDVILFGCVVWGKITCRIPSQTSEIEKTTSEWGHMALRDNIGPDLFDWL